MCIEVIYGEVMSGSGVLSISGVFQWQERAVFHVALCFGSERARSTANTRCTRRSQELQRSLTGIDRNLALRVGSSP